MLMELNESEVKVIEKIRADQELARMKKMFQELCVHEHMEYVGHGHNDDCYECKACGYKEWR